MIIVVLAVLGLLLGSFVNALVWRLHQQESGQHADKDLSILKGRSMCPHCKHTLAPKDLLPVVSWLLLKGKCRYCHKAISWQYPVVELITAGLFVFSYLFWPQALQGQQALLFSFWLLFVTGFVALTVYDLKWMLLPNRIVFPLMGLAIIQWLDMWMMYGLSLTQLLHIGLAVLICGGIFYLLFQLSGGKWIGGGDVKLGFLLGLIVAEPKQGFLLLFIAALLGSFVSIPLIAFGKAGRKTRLPFGPFLMLAAVIVVLFGSSLIAWYERSFLLY